MWLSPAWRPLILHSSENEGVWRVCWAANERQHDSLPTDQTFCPHIVAKMWRSGCVEHSYLIALHTIAFLQRMAHSHSRSVTKDCTLILLQPMYRKLTQCSPVWLPNVQIHQIEAQNLKTWSGRWIHCTLILALFWCKKKCCHLLFCLDLYSTGAKSRTKCW